MKSENKNNLLGPMWNFKNLVSLLLVSSLAVGNLSYSMQQEQEKKTITRVKRPDLQDSKRNDIYFEDIFAEGLVGPKPEIEKSIVAPAGGGDSVVVASSSDRWSSFISRDAIEDEVKLSHRKMQTMITTPSGFNNKFREVRQQFEMLSMLFGIIHEYDDEVRWKKFAGTFQKNCASTATKARTPSRPSFQAAKLTRDDLGELIRGGGIDIADDLPNKLEWSSVIQRRPIMVHLEDAVGEVLKPGVSNEEEFTDNKDRILRSANLVSAMAKVLIKEGMDESDDDGYVSLSKKMGAAAKQLMLATESDEFDAAASAVNKIEQSCIECHSEWR